MLTVRTILGTITAVGIGINILSIVLGISFLIWGYKAHRFVSSVTTVKLITIGLALLIADIIAILICRVIFHILFSSQAAAGILAVYFNYVFLTYRTQLKLKHIQS